MPYWHGEAMVSYAKKTTASGAVHSNVTRKSFWFHPTIRECLENLSNNNKMTHEDA